MPSLAQETITVAELTKYGFKSAAGEYVNWSQKLPPAVKGLIMPGGTYTLDLYISDQGKKYVNALAANVTVPGTTPPVAPPTTAPTTTHKPAPKYTPKAPAQNDNSMSKEEWAAKDRRISRQGAIQVAVQVTQSFEAAVELADKMLEYVNA